jgi:prepilin-type N-terminal cleavage/methylation domain-containing protein
MTVDITPQTATTKRDKGFTLVELLIVIAILGVLATITVLSVRGITNRGAEQACRADSKTLDVAFEAFNTGGTVPSGASFTLGADAEATLLNANLLKSVSPKWVLAANGTKTVQTGGGCTLAWGA